MTGAEHYAAAERLLSEASFGSPRDHPEPVYDDGSERPYEVHRCLTRRAQVHATLALADAQRRTAEASRKANR
jgi:hypothetical protein